MSLGRPDQGAAAGKGTRGGDHLDVFQAGGAAGLEDVGQACDRAASLESVAVITILRVGIFLGQGLEQGGEIRPSPRSDRWR